MVALTPRQVQKRVYKSKLARGAGASYGHDMVLNTQSPKFEKIMGEGLSTFGSGVTSFGGALQSMGSGGLYTFGSGVAEMGTGLMPFGIGIIDKLKGFAKKAHSVIKGAVPAQLRRAALDFGKKKARELLPQVTSRVKAEIAKEAPGLVARLTDPLVGKLPVSLQGHAQSALRSGVQQGLAGLESGLSQAEAMAMKRLGGSGVSVFGGGMGGTLEYPTPVASSYPIDYNQRQLGFMRQQGLALEQQRQAGNVPKRLVLDQHSQSLLDIIRADKGYDRAKTQDAFEQMGMQYAPQSTESMGPLTMKKPKKTKKATASAASDVPKRKPGRPKGSKNKGKGIVYL